MGNIKYHELICYTDLDSDYCVKYSYDESDQTNNTMIYCILDQQPSHVRPSHHVHQMISLEPGVG